MAAWTFISSVVCILLFVHVQCEEEQEANTPDNGAKANHPFFEQWFLPFRRKLFCFLSKFKNKNRFEILVQFPD